MKKLFIIMGLCSGLCAGAQTLHISGTVKCDEAEMKLYVSPLENHKQGDDYPITLTDGKFEVELPQTSDGLYQLYGVYKRSQFSSPLYVKGAEKNDVNLDLSEGRISMEMDDNNHAFSEFNTVVYQNARKLWEQGKELTKEDLLALLANYDEAEAAIEKKYECADVVKQYLRIWAYMMKFSGYNNSPLGDRRKENTNKVPLFDVLSDPTQVLDTPMTFYFSLGRYLVSQSIPKGALKERFENLYSRYQNKLVRTKVGEQLIQEYIAGYNYSEQFEEGLDALTTVCKEYGFDEKYVRDFKSRKASVKGTPFPANVVLTDVDGNKVDFAQFKGYYVYVDMWASWCGPCCREVPHLQAMEKSVQNPLVKFVSISIDRGTKEWKAKMTALNMHGNQYINQDNSLAESLNIQGIPHFLIYDKEGNLYQYQAPRPSTGEELKNLLESLK